MSNNEYIQPFYNGTILKSFEKRSRKQVELAIGETRLDISRINIIALTKILHYLLEKRFQEVYVENRGACDACDFFIMAIEEFVMNPIICDHY